MGVRLWGIVGEGGEYSQEMDLTLSSLSHQQGSDLEMIEILSTWP